MQRKKILMSFIFPTIIFSVGIGLQLLIWFNVINTDNTEKIDRRLLYAANAIQFLLPENYHFSNMSKDSYNYEWSIELFSTLDQEAKKLEVDYIYTMVKKDGKIYYTTMSDSIEELLATDAEQYYWYPLEDTEDDSYGTTMDFFDNPRIIYLESTDKWGSYRSVYVPQRSDDGTLYLAGADIFLDTLNKELITNLGVVFINLSLILIATTPLLFAFKSVKKSQQDYQRKVAKLRSYDELTGVFNRTSGLRILSNQISLYEKYNIPFSIFLVDIANLDSVNRLQGIKRGDTLIKVLASMLSITFRKSDKVIRLGEDDFMVVLSECCYEVSDLFTEKLIKKIATFNTHNRNGYSLRVNVVFSEYEGQGLDHFLDSAMQKLEERKKKGNFYDITFQEKIKEGLIHNEFKVWFQPKVDIKTKHISFEALLRWKSKDLEYIAPDKFIPIAEKSYLIFSLTKFVLEEVMKAIEVYGCEVSVNLSPVVFEKETFFTSLLEKVRSFPYRDNIKFEITEGLALRNLNQTVDKILAFNELNVDFSMDDFGTGYSSLGYLSILPMKEIKIDKSFVKKLSTREENKIIIEMIVRLGELLGFQVVAEGVEDLDHIHILQSIGCHIFQGFYFDKAVPIEEAMAKLEKKIYVNRIDF